MVDNSLVLENQSKPQYNLKTKTDHSTLIARTLPLSKTLRDKIPKATMKITDFVKPPSRTQHSTLSYSRQLIFKSLSTTPVKSKAKHNYD
jgi:hypothetical protein